jgi:hypothetical protein
MLFSSIENSFPSSSSIVLITLNSSFNDSLHWISLSSYHVPSEVFNSFKDLITLPNTFRLELFALESLLDVGLKVGFPIFSQSDLLITLTFAPESIKRLNTSLELLSITFKIKEL